MNGAFKGILYLIVILVSVGCAGTARYRSYEVRAHPPGGDDANKIELSNMKIAVSVSPLSSDRKVLDVKARVENRGLTQLVLTNDGAKLVAGERTWLPVAWKAYWGDSLVVDTVSVAPGATLGVLCAFEMPHGSRERFPERVELTLGSLFREGIPLELGKIELYVPDD